ncbi:MAG: hypothetical protein LBL24_05775 [Bacteroidales bacterium]|jgi:hypothetical protein|nr:hypothetical protein [Bacteroidales bacterium]
MMQIKSQVTQIIVLIVIQVFFFACKRDDPPDYSPPASNRRTVLVYLGTDNNFRAEAAQKTGQLKNGWNRDIDGNLLVYADAGDHPSLIHIYTHPQKGNMSDTVEIYPPENSAGAVTLTRVLNRVREYRPAASYGLVVLSHATGWLPATMSNPSPQLRSVILDNGTAETGNYMELADFAAAIPYKMDFIIFDACFMGSVEVCYELKEKTDYIVASPAEVVSPGFVYSTMPERLFTYPQADLQGVAQDFYDCFNAQSGLFRSATVSVVRTAGLDAVAGIFKEVAGQASNEKDISLNDIQTFGYGQQKIYFDLGDYAKHLSPDSYSEFTAELDGCIVYKAHTDSYYTAGAATLLPIRSFSGLSVYIPQNAYPEANAKYRELKWTAEN